MLDDPRADGADDPPAAGIGSEGDRGGRREDHTRSGRGMVGADGHRGRRGRGRSRPSSSGRRWCRERRTAPSSRRPGRGGRLAGDRDPDAAGRRSGRSRRSATPATMNAVTGAIKAGRTTLVRTAVPADPAGARRQRSAPPARPPMRAWDELDGSPRTHVARFQAIAPTRAGEGDRLGDVPGRFDDAGGDRRRHLQRDERPREVEHRGKPDRRRRGRQGAASRSTEAATLAVS